MDWLLPVLDKIKTIALEAVGTEGLSTDTGGSPVRSDFEGNGVAPDSKMSTVEAHTQVRNGGTIIGVLLSDRVPPTLLDHFAPTTRHHFGIPTGMYSLPAVHHASAPR